MKKHRTGLGAGGWGLGARGFGLLAAVVLLPFVFVMSGCAHGEARGIEGAQDDAVHLLALAAAVDDVPTLAPPLQSRTAPQVEPNQLALPTRVEWSDEIEAAYWADQGGVATRIKREQSRPAATRQAATVQLATVQLATLTRKVSSDAGERDATTKPPGDLPSGDKKRREIDAAQTAAADCPGGKCGRRGASRAGRLREAIGHLLGGRRG